MISHQKNFFWYAFPPVSYRMISIVLLPVLTRILTPSELGLASVAMVIGSFTGMVVLPGLEGLYLRYGFSVGEKGTSFSKHFSMLFALHLCLALVLGPLLGAGVITLFSGYLPNVPVLFTILAVGDALITSFHAPYLSYLRAAQKVKELAIFQISESFMKTVLVLLGLFAFKWGALSLLLAEILPTFVLLPFSLRILSDARQLRLNQDSFFPLLKAILASGPDGIVYWAFTAVDRFLLNYFRGAVETGIYTAIYPLSSFIVSMEWIFQRQVKVLIYQLRLSKQGRAHELKELYLGNLRLFVGICGLCALLAPVLLPQLIGEQFHGGISIAPILCLVALLRVPEFFFKTYCWADDRKRLLSLSNGVAALLFVTGNSVLIPQFGFRGAAWAGVIGLGTYPLFILLFRRELRELIPQRSFWNFGVIGSLILLFLSFRPLPPVFVWSGLLFLSTTLTITYLKYFKFLGVLSNTPGGRVLVELK